MSRFTLEEAVAEGQVLSWFDAADGQFTPMVYPRRMYLDENYETYVPFYNSNVRYADVDFDAEDWPYSETRNITISRLVPDMDYVFAHENRLFGFKGDTIYASKWGDIFNWNVFDGLASDSWATETGTPGSFVGGISYGGYLRLFKENYIFTLYGDNPGEYGDSLAYMAAVVMRGTDNRFYVHEVVGVDGGYIKKANSSDAIKTRVTGQAGVTSESELSNNIISDSSENSNPILGQRSNIPGLTRWDREAEAREARYSVAEDAGEVDNKSRSGYADEAEERRREYGITGTRESNDAQGEESGRAEAEVSGNDRRGVYPGSDRTVGRDPGGEKRSGWDELTDFQQQRAAKVITDFAEENGSVEADMLRKDWGDDRAFAKSIYDQYSQGNIFLEQAETYLPGTKSLAEMLDREFNPDYKEPENWMSNKREAQAERAPVLRESKETVNRPRFSVAEETDRKAVEDMTAQELRRAVAEDKADVNFYEKALALNIPEETKAEMRTKLTEIRERLGKEQARVREIEQKAREERKAAEKRERKRVAPTQAKKDFRKRLLPRRCTATTRLSRATTPPPTPTAATPTRRRVYTT